MSGWIVYSKDGLTERCRLKSLEYSGNFMSDRSVTATFEYHSEVAFEVFDYIVYRGEKFELEAVPSVKKTSRNNYEYELRFVSLKYELERCEMRDIVPNDNGVVYPTPLTFSFTGDVEYLAERIQANLDALYGEGVWNIVVSDNTISDEKNITIGQQNCWNALSLVNTTYGLNFSVRGREVVIGGELESVSHTFQYGKGNGLYEIERVSDTNTGIVTKLRAYGGTRNLDYSYPKKPEWTDSVLPVSFALSPLRLMLPSFKEDGKTDFVLADESTIAKYGIREASIIYEDVYPSITDAKNSSGEAIDEIAGVDEVDESVNTFTVYLRDLGFDLNEHLTTSEAQLSMKTGTLQGYTFNISTIEKLSNGGYKLTLGKNSLEDSEESGAYVPNTNWNMSAGDKFVLLNILMPQTYIREAEQRLLSRAKEYLAEYGKTNFSYTIGLHDKFLMEHPAVYDSLIEGVKLKVYDDELGISEEVTIQSITITENIEDNILPQVKVTLNNKPSASTLDRIQGKLNDIANETASNSFTSQNELMKQYRKKLDKPFFDKLFVAIDEEGNEIASNDVTTPVSYIKAKYSFVTVGGMTMYAEGGDVDIPTIYDGLPIDNQTLVWEDTGGGKVLKINPNIDLGGGLDETQLAEYLTNNNYAKTSDITSALSGYATTTQLEAVNTRIDNFLEGSDTDGIINKWLELEAFLSGLSQSDNLADILSTKISKTEASAMFVTTDETEQTILGKKNFTGGLKVNGSPIYYDATNKYWKLEGDLLVTGGVSMYSDDSAFTPSTIMDGVIVDGTSIRKNPTTGALEVIGGSGSTTKYPLSWSGFNQGSYDGSVAQSFYIPTKLSEFVNDRSFATTSDLSGYLPTSGGTINGTLVISHASWGAQLTINRSGGNGNSVIKYTNSVNGLLGSIGIGGGGSPSNAYQPVFNDKNNTEYQIYHSGNLTPTEILTQLKTVDGEGSGLDADLLDGMHLATSEGVMHSFKSGKYTTVNQYFGNGVIVEIDPLPTDDTSLYDNTSVFSLGASAARNRQFAFDWKSYEIKYRYISQSSGVIQYNPWKIIAFTDSNVASATKLQTARTIWGQSFDGTANVSGDILLSNGYAIRFLDSLNKSYREVLSLSSSDVLRLGYGTRPAEYSTEILGYTTKFIAGGNIDAMLIHYSGNVLIGTTTNSGYKLDVNGDVRIGNTTSANLRLARNSINYIIGGSDDSATNASIALSVGGSSQNIALLISNQKKATFYGDVDINTKLTINSIPIYKSQDDVLYIDGNLVVRGGVTMYAENEVDIPSIIDSLPIASNTALGVSMFDSTYFSVDANGMVTLTSSPSSVSVLSDLLDVDASVSGTATVDRVLYQAAGTSTWTWRELPKDGVVGDYLPLTGGTLSGLLRIDFINSIDNISSAVGLHVLRSAAQSDEWGAGVALTAYQGKGSVIMSGGYGGSITYYNGYSYLDRATLRWDNKGNLFVPNVMFEKGGSVAEQYKCGMYVWDNILQITKRQLDLTYIKELMGIDLLNEIIKCHAITEFTDYIQTDGRYAYIASASFNSAVASGGWAVGHILRKADKSFMGYSCGGFGIGDNLSYYFYGGDYDAHAMRLIGNNMLVTGGITMYSDQRKKTILNHVELSLKQIADAPLIEHYYLSDQDKTTHVGSIAQYWAGLNDWFCKKDAEGYYTMEIQNAALASAISIARELTRYESKTDKKIRQLKKRISQLGDEVELLKQERGYLC